MVYDNICRIAEKKNISVQRLEKKAGLGNGAICKWKNSSPSLQNLEKVANALGVSVAYLIREQKQEEKPDGMW